jgi:malonyl-CoA/methylmalonyl-CoA synthetase
MSSSTPTHSRRSSSSNPISFFPDKLREHDKNKVALVHGAEQYTYGQVNDRSDRIAFGLLLSSSSSSPTTTTTASCQNDNTHDGNNNNNKKSQNDYLHEERIALFLSASLDYVTAMHGVWRAGGMVVPLHTEHVVAAELEYYLTSAGVTRVISNTECLVPTNGSLQLLCQQLGIQLLTVDNILADAVDATAAPLSTNHVLDFSSSSRRAMILYTSGTTSKPKGVVTTHQNICAQIKSLITAWAWTTDDVVPLFLPLHHVHGIINVLSCALWAGATVHLFAKFAVQEICQHVAAERYTLFMAVPTIYVKLLQYLDTSTGEQRTSICGGFRAMRLNVSGSAACPVSLFEQWQLYTGQVLLERYGMTEIGMALSNPYHHCIVGQRKAGCVGQPLPGVQVHLFEESSSSPIVDADVPGEIRIKGDTVFLEYWNNVEATTASFKDGWFCTGDIAILEPELKYYKIMGRSSIDIIKSGGYKLSALEIEGVLLTHPQIAEVAVIGVPDDTWGQIVVAFCCLQKGDAAATATLDYEDLKAWCKDKMSSHKIPKRIKILDELPRNAMGKVTKPLLQTMV